MSVNADVAHIQTSHTSPDVNPDTSPLIYPASKIHIFGIFLLFGLTLAAITAAVGTAIAGIVALSVSSGSIVGMGAAIGAGVGFLAAASFAIFVATRTYRPLPPGSASKWDPKLHGETPPLPIGTQTTNNKVLVTHDSPETTEWRYHLLRSAKSSIEISGNFCGGEVFRKALSEIETAMTNSPALRVHILSVDELIEREDSDFLERLKKTYGDRFNYIITNKRSAFLPNFTVIENHMKLVLIDEKYYSIGGSGLQDNLCAKGDTPHVPRPNASWYNYALEKFWTGSARDQDVVCEGAEVAKQCRWTFFELFRDWDYQMNHRETLPPTRYFPVKLEDKSTCPEFEAIAATPRVVPNVRLSFLSSHPIVNVPEQPNPITRRVIQMFESAKDTIDLGNMLFHLADPKLESALLNAAGRVRKIRVITNGEHPNCSGSVPIFAKAHLAHYERLHAKAVNNNVQIYHFNVPNTLYHKKVTVVDKRYSMIGSWNFGLKCMAFDYEAVLDIDNEEIAKQLKASIEIDQTRFSEEVLPSRQYSCWERGVGALQRKLVANVFI